MCAGFSRTADWGTMMPRCRGGFPKPFVSSRKSKTRAPIGGERWRQINTKTTTTCNYRSEPRRQSYRHTTDSTHALSSLVAFLSIMEAGNECFICRFVLRPTEENRTICLSCTTRLYMRENMRYDHVSVLDNFFSSSRIGTLPMRFTIFLHSFRQWIILPTKSVHWSSFLIDNVNDIFYLFSGEFRC